MLLSDRSDLGCARSHLRQEPRRDHQAPFCRHLLPERAHRLAALPLVHGRLPVGGGQHLVPHLAAGRVQATGPDTAVGAGGCLAALLLVVDRHSHVHLSVHHVHLLSHGARGSGQDADLVALAHDVHACPPLFVYTELEVELRSLQTNHCSTVWLEERGGRCVEWIVGRMMQSHC